MLSTMSPKDRKTLKQVFARPARTDIDWADMESMLRGVEVEVQDRSASRIALVKAGEVMVVCRPHSKPLAVQATVRDVAAFLKVVGVKP